ncbi:MAG: SUMF1/EgtB/PvdO family nonheme iron enzyme [Betaproteobacteria bacterium]|nr:SUMF1/EgtB/PvdO family nonheme iron enzyme [Betaproteobacteria bacterium]
MNAPDTPLAQASDADIFVTVPEVTLPSGIVVPSFQVGKYACTNPLSGKAAVTADGKPWVNISYHDARQACENAGYRLITETEWLAIAWDAANQDCNWTKGKVGAGKLFRGLRKGNVTSAQPGSFEPEDKKERRWLTLSNGECICDWNGNLYQWIYDDVQGDENGIVANAFAADSPSIATAPYPSLEKGIGWRPPAGDDWSGLALIRGGYWSSGSNAGVFYLSLVWPDREYGSVGFRCTK